MNPIAAARAVVTNPYSAVLAVITLTLLAVSLGRLNKTKTKADYLVVGRSLPAFVLIFTLLSSWIGSGSLLGGAENAYRHGPHGAHLAGAVSPRHTARGQGANDRRAFSDGATIRTGSARCGSRQRRAVPKTGRRSRAPRHG